MTKLSENLLGRHLVAKDKDGKDIEGGCEIIAVFLATVPVACTEGDNKGIWTTKYHPAELLHFAAVHPNGGVFVGQVDKITLLKD